MIIALVGAGCFGLVIGWITYRTLRRRAGNAALSDIAVVIGAVGGGAVTALFQEPDIFGAYAIGLAVGFFGYLLATPRMSKQDDWMGDPEREHQ